MRFASLQSSGNGAKYAQAGKAVADSSARVFDTQRKTGPDYAGISKTAMKTAAEEKIAGMKAEASVAKAGINAVADMKQTQIKTEVFKRGEELKNKQRKAGGIAAIGKIAGAGFLAATDNTKGRERPKADLQGFYDSRKTKHDGIKDRHKSESDALGDYQSGTFKAPDTSTGDGSGKATSGTGGSNLSSSLTGNQKIVADAIAKYESGDWGYEAFNQGGAEGGTKVLGKSGSHKQTFGRSLTDMTLGEIFHKQNTKSRGLSMDEHIKSGGLHAVGRYQFIGSTLQDEVARMGLSSDTKFTPQVQDQIWLNHIKRVGNISPWVGPSNNYSSGQKSEFNSMIQSF